MRLLRSLLLTLSSIAAADTSLPTEKLAPHGATHAMLGPFYSMNAITFETDGGTTWLSGPKPIATASAPAPFLEATVATFGWSGAEERIVLAVRTDAGWYVSEEILRVRIPNHCFARARVEDIGSQAIGNGVTALVARVSSYHSCESARNIGYDPSYDDTQVLVVAGMGASGIPFVTEPVPLQAPDESPWFELRTRFRKGALVVERRRGHPPRKLLGTFPLTFP